MERKTQNSDSLETSPPYISKPTTFVVCVPTCFGESWLGISSQRVSHLACCRGRLPLVPVSLRAAGKVHIKRLGPAETRYCLLD